MASAAAGDALHVQHVCSDSVKAGDLPPAPANFKTMAEASPRQLAPLPPPAQRKSLQGGHDSDSALAKAEAAARLAGRSGSGSMHEEL
jgi:hypothetical protein